MPSPRTIAVVTGTRAEYGLLLPVIRAVDEHPRLALRLVVTGTHLVTRSMKDITFPITAKVAMQKRGQVGRLHDAAALGRGVTGLAGVFEKTKPAMVVVLGDRVEAFAAAASASVSGIRVVHLHGGDRAEGVADEAMRHAITKLAHLHLPATAQSRRRILRMGEHADVVFNVGSPAIDGLHAIAPADDAPRVIVLQHPVGDDDDTEHQRMANTLRATARFSRLVLAPNHDPGRRGILRAIREAKVEAVDHLPRERFVSLLKSAEVIVGNSSAGLIEAAACRTPCVNLGSRQNGREKPNSVIDAPHTQRGIATAIKAAAQLDRRRFRHPYGRGNTGTRVAELLAELDLGSVPLRKQNAY